MKVKVGIVAYRRPDGSFLPAQPIYREFPGVKDETELWPMDALIKIFADKYKKDKMAQLEKEKHERKQTADPT